MTATELALQVADMRRLQREYFRTRSPHALDEARRAERAVDEAVKSILTQPTLTFGDDPS